MFCRLLEEEGCWLVELGLCGGFDFVLDDFREELLIGIGEERFGAGILQRNPLIRNTRMDLNMFV